MEINLSFFFKENGQRIILFSEENVYGHLFIPVKNPERALMSETTIF